MKKPCCHKKLSTDKAKEVLKEHGLNRTSIKINVLVLLSRSSIPLSINDMHKKSGINHCDVSSVFRTITQFKEKGLVKELNLGEDFCRYELASTEDSSHHHHHVRCRDCGSIKLLGHCDISEFQKMIAKLGFQEMEHSLEFTGICSNCSGA